MNQPDHRPTIDELLDRAVQATNRGDREAAEFLAGQVLALDSTNVDAEELLAAPSEKGEIRRLTIMFADLVDSTELSTRIEPETYRTVVGRYRDEVRKNVAGYDGHIAFTKGDGLLAVFGHPHAHENDVHRATSAGLDIVRSVAELSDRVRRQFEFDINVRVGIHRGIVYLDTEQDDVYGFAANLAARVCSLADPGTVAVSGAVEPLISDTFELQARIPKSVKGIDEPVRYFNVIGERDMRRVALGPLVGRRAEMAYLEDSWNRAAMGRLQTPGVALQGEAGIGKSRLAWAVVELAERSHAVILQLIGSPFHSDVGFRPVRRLLERRCGIGRATDPSDRLGYLEREIRERSLDPDTLIPLLAPVLGVEPQAGYQAVRADGRALYERIAAAVREYLIACVREGPSLILVEDMHWFDEDTRELIDALLTEDLGNHLLIVMTGRDAALLPEGPAVQTFRLSPLSEDESDQLIVALHPEMTSGARRAVRRRCDGIPLYIEEVVAKLKEVPSDESMTAGVPDTLYEALFARLRSSTDALLVVEAAAVIGGRIERPVLFSVLDLEEDVFDRVVGELIDGRVLELLDENSFRFRHELLREVAAELSPPTIRRGLHGRIADALVSTTDGNPDWPSVARHNVHAERFPEAASAYRQASADARRRGALGEARTYLTHAVSAAEQMKAGPERDQLQIALRLRRGFLASAAEGVSSPNAAADFERCLQLTSADLRDDEFFATLVALYGYYAIRADLDRAERLLGSVRTALTGRREWFRPFNDAGFGMLSWYRGEFDTARDQLAAAAAARSDEGAHELASVWFMPNEGTASIYTHLALARYVTGDFAAAEQEFARTAQRCDELDFPQGAFSLAYARQLEVLMRIEAGQLDQALETAGQLAVEGNQYGFDSWAMVGAVQQVAVTALASLATNEADPVALQGQIETLTSFVDAWRAFEVKCLITTYDGFIARLLMAAGRPAEARDRVDIGLALAEETGMHYYDAELLRIRAGTHDDDTERRKDLAAAMALARRQGATIFELRIAAQDFELRGDEARQPLLDAIGRFPDGSTWPDLERARALLG
ncbi:adenylate/guanylate cyclase domain-containing protein [Mycolicibacterium moriokaense]|nr:adenylate/guanylate cyclase domain-containing protein [Mycolicibacterium moriokaense]